MKKIRNTKVLLPNMFTVVNMFCGFYAIILVFQERFVIASWLILIASLFDAVDGKIARLTNTMSKFGIEFDSLADFISFGIAPSVIMHKLYFHDLGNIGIIISFIPTVCGAFRLGRFNVTSTSLQKNSYLGLPIPLYASAIASFVIFNFSIWEQIKLDVFLLPLTLMLSVLMVSKVKYEKLPQFKLSRNKKNNINLIFLFLFLIVIAHFKEKGIFPVIMTIILQGVINWLISLFKSHREPADVPLSD